MWRIPAASKPRYNSTVWLPGMPNTVSTPYPRSSVSSAWLHVVSRASSVNLRYFPVIGGCACSFGRVPASTVGEAVDEFNGELGALNHVFHGDAFVVAVNAAAFRHGNHEGAEPVAGNAQVAEKVTVGKAGEHSGYHRRPGRPSRHDGFDESVQGGVRAGHRRGERHELLDAHVAVVDDGRQLTDENLRVLVRQQPAVQFHGSLGRHHVDFVAAVEARDRAGV